MAEEGAAFLDYQRTETMGCLVADYHLCALAHTRSLTRAAVDICLGTLDGSQVYLIAHRSEKAVKLVQCR